MIKKQSEFFDTSFEKLLRDPMRLPELQIHAALEIPNMILQQALGMNGFFTRFSGVHAEIAKAFKTAQRMETTFRASPYWPYTSIEVAVRFFGKSKKSDHFTLHVTVTEQCKVMIEGIITSTASPR